MATNLVSLITQFLTPDIIARIASALRLDPSVAQRAVSASVPAILAGLAGVASTREGARQLSNAASQQQTTGVLDILKTIGGPGQTSLVESGSHALSSLLGGGTVNALAGAIGKFASTGEGTSKSLLGMLSPMVLGVLGQQQRSSGLDANGLATLLASQKDQIAAAIPSGLASQLSGTGVLDALEEGARSSAAAAMAAARRAGSASERTFAGASQAAQAARSSASSQWPYWLIGLAVLAALAWYFLAGRDGDQVAEQTRPTATQPVQPPRATTGVATPSLTVRGINLSDQVDASVNLLKTTLTDITDVASAQAAVPKIQAATAQLDSVNALAVQLPPDGKTALAGLIAAATPAISQLCDRVLAIPGVGGVAKPAIDELRARLDSLTRA
jgi:hypothetical protein